MTGMMEMNTNSSTTEEDSSFFGMEMEETDQQKVTEDGPSAPKRPHLQINTRTLLPELEKHWETVDKDPSDFTSWTYLLQYVDQENEVLAAREAYGAFLTRYPYCYGYWKKYADYEKRKGTTADCDEVFRRGLKAVPLSVDLWIHYLNYIKSTRENQSEFIRCQFEAALQACGMEFRSDKLWEHFIHWEKEGNNWKNVLNLYDRVIAMPTQNHLAHFTHMVDFIKEYSPEEILSEDELDELKAALGESGVEVTEELLRDKMIEKRREIYKKNEEEVKLRWEFEEAIKRPYFHVKPLEKAQLKIWKEYLDFEISRGDYKRIITLFERCLIACALYEEYWIKYTRFLQSSTPLDEDLLRNLFQRGCEVHHKGKLWINLYWSEFEEQLGNVDRASEILDNIEKILPDSLHVKYRRINLERRRGNLTKCEELFQKYITSCKNSATSVHLTIKYARFLSQRMMMYDRAKKLLEDTVDLDENNRAKVIMALIDLGMQRNPMDMDLILGTFNRALQGTLTDEQKITIAHRKVEFLEDYSTDLNLIQEAHVELQSIAKSIREKQQQENGGKDKDVDGKKGNSAKSTGENEENVNNNMASKSNGLPPSIAVDSSVSYQQQYSDSTSTVYGQQYDQFGEYSNWSSTSGYSTQSQHGWTAYQGYYG